MIMVFRVYEFFLHHILFTPMPYTFIAPVFFCTYLGFSRSGYFLLFFLPVLSFAFLLVTAHRKRMLVAPFPFFTLPSLFSPSS